MRRRFLIVISFILSLPLMFIATISVMVISLPYYVITGENLLERYIDGLFYFWESL